MTHGSLEAAWADGGAALGGWVSNLEFSPDLYRRAEYDYIGIDCQHTVLSEAQVAATIVKMAPGGPAVVVRVSKNDSALIGKLCDAGADGIIVPMVNNAEEAAAAVAATRYPPRGVRSFGPHGPALRGQNLTQLGDRVSVFAMVETSDGLKNVDQIAAVEGLAGIYVGPADLSIGLGLDPMQAFSSDQLVEPVGQIRKACENSGIILGMHQANAATSITWVKRGVRFATISNDAGLFATAAGAALAEVKKGVA
jgi:2-keto-3-deoxy-L-rhamnonate aldolase RhmA